MVFLVESDGTWQGPRRQGEAKGGQSRSGEKGRPWAPLVGGGQLQELTAEADSYLLTGASHGETEL